MKRQTGVAKLIILFFILLYFQIILLLSLNNSKSGYFAYNIKISDIIETSALVLLLITVFAIFSVQKIFNKLHEEIEHKIKETSLDNINEVIDTLRSQRHDFIKHLNCIYSLLSQGHIDKSKEYIKGISTEIKDLGPPINCDNLWISALLQSKRSKAQSQNTNIIFEIRGKLTDFPLSPWEISKVLGNLIDNSLEAVEILPESDRNVLVYIGEDRHQFIFRVSNPGKTISEEEKELIFKRGYSTKESEGLGLNIVKSITESYNGSVFVKSQEELTSFEIKIPKRGNADNDSHTSRANG
jgi:sensor histidine kinase regulating citrate/malate metabolism